MMSVTMAPVLVRLSQWATATGLEVNTINRWKQRFDDFPEPAQRITSTMHLYRQSDLERFLKRHPTLGHGRPGVSR